MKTEVFIVIAVISIALIIYIGGEWGKDKELYAESDRLRKERKLKKKERKGQ